MKDSFDIIYHHVAHTLPDSIADRREILQAVHNVITDEHPIKPVVAAQLATLDALGKLQLEFRNILRS